MIQAASWIAAFWTAVLLFEAASTRSAQLRFVTGLALGAGTAHLGWALLHLGAVVEHPWGLFDPTTGFCVLFLPIGVWLLAPIPSAFRTLPLALALARLGCLIGDCCGGREGEPTQIVEIAAGIALHSALRRLPDWSVVPVFMIGFGLVRLLVEPWRAEPPLGPPWIDPAWIALAWVIAGGVGLGLSERGGSYAGLVRATSGST